MDETHPASATQRTSTSQTKAIHRPIRPPAARKARRWPFMLLSLVLGAIVWAGIDMKRMQDSELEVELELQQIIPADWQSSVLSADRVVVSVRGSKQATATIREDSLLVEPTIPAEAFEGDVFEGKIGISPGQVRGLPPGVQAFTVKPDVVTVRFDRMVTRYMAVKPAETVGVPATGQMVGKIGRPEPPDLPITGPKTLLDNLAPEDVIHTPPLNIEGKRGMVKEWVKPLPFVKNGKTIEVEGMVEVSAELTESPMQRTLEQPVDVKALIDSPFERYGDLALSPPAVAVTISGAKSAVESFNPNEIVVYADIRERLPAAPGEYNMKCRFIAPPRITVVKIEPDTIKWITREAAAGQEKQPVPAEPAPGNGAGALNLPESR